MPEERQAPSLPARPTWADLKDRAPDLCAAVIDWIEARRCSCLTYADLADALRGEPNDWRRAVDSLRAFVFEDLRLRAAEYRLEAEAILARHDVRFVAQRPADLDDWRGRLANALDAAATEAEALAEVPT